MNDNIMILWIINNFNMIDNLKVQTHMVLCKIQSEIIKMESQ